MFKLKLLGPKRPLLIAALLLSIPAFYLSIATSDILLPEFGRLLYALMSLILLVEFGLRINRGRKTMVFWRRSVLDIVIFFGALASCLSNNIPWSAFEWILRLGLTALIFARIVLLLAHWVAPNRLMRIMFIAAGLWGIAGAGFYWLEPQVNSFADGLWLAFITGATVGYGDLVPSTHASRIFAVFIVLLGYAIFSFVTAGISALFVGEDERRLTRELHADIRILRQEITILRHEILEVKTMQEPSKETEAPKIHPPSL